MNILHNPCILLWDFLLFYTSSYLLPQHITVRPFQVNEYNVYRPFSSLVFFIHCLREKIGPAPLLPGMNRAVLFQYVLSISLFLMSFPPKFSWCGALILYFYIISTILNVFFVLYIWLQ